LRGGPRYAATKESLTALSPLAILPRASCRGCIDGLMRRVSNELLGTRDNDYDRTDYDDDVSNDGADRPRSFSLAGAGSGAGVDDGKDGRGGGGSRVRFHDVDYDVGGGGGITRIATGPSLEQPARNADIDPRGQLLPISVGTYRPSRREVRCALGMTLFYVAMRVRDRTTDKSSSADGRGSRTDQRDMDDDDATTRALLTNCASVLLPEIFTGGDDSTMTTKDLSEGGRGTRSIPPLLRNGGGVIILAVGVSGPAYDLYGGSSVVSTLPKRLRECAMTLATLDAAGTSPRAMPPYPSPRDPAYFHRLYVALLAALMDDDDGLMRDHDEIEATLSARRGGYGGGVDAGSGTASFLTGPLGNRGVGAAVRKKKLFTFSRGGGKDGSAKGGSSRYAPRGMRFGGDVTAGGGGGLPQRMSNADVVQQTAQRLELLSIVDDEMALPEYSHATDGRRTPSIPSTHPAKSPRRSKIRGHLSAPTGRLGRLPAPSDLSGFEYRPQPSPRHHHREAPHGGSLISGTTASTSMMGGSDDASVQTEGDDATAATVGSRYTTSSSSTSSLVPTLSKSRRDLLSIAGSTKSSRSKFIQRKGREKGGERTTMTQQATSKPPLFPPQQRSHPEPAYDPFSMDDFDDYGEDDKMTGESHTVSSGTSPERDTNWAPTTPDDQTPVTSDDQTSTTLDNHTPRTPSAPESNDILSLSSMSPPETPQDDFYSSPTAQVMEGTSRSISDVKESANTLHSLPENDPSTIEEEPLANAESMKDMVVTLATKEEGKIHVALEPKRKLDICLALNEDLMCEYHRSKLSSLSVDGTVQVSVKTRYDLEPTPLQRQRPTAPFSLIFLDRSGHIKALQENKKFVENVVQGDIANREFAYTVRVPREDEYFPVVRYKCGTSLRPVPIRVQIRVKTQGKFCRVALQISSNPQNPSGLVNLTIIMSVPDGLRGESLICNPPGGVWNETKRVVLWCVSELDGGEKFQLQSIFELMDESLNSNELEFPVLVRCQCTGGQLSDVVVEVSDLSDAHLAEVSMSIARRFRVSHKESNK
ncbi:hypothetical protein ACHAXA_009538, partial [Cyclostephanos tholiformis]